MGHDLTAKAVLLVVVFIGLGLMMEVLITQDSI